MQDWREVNDGVSPLNSMDRITEQDIQKDRELKLKQFVPKGDVDSEQAPAPSARDIERELAVEAFNNKLDWHVDDCRRIEMFRAGLRRVQTGRRTG